jgi:hypothetical protein
MISWQNCLRCLGIWRRIFLRSTVTGAAHVGDQVPSRYWRWPKDTYLQRRLEYLKRRLYPKSVPDRSTELRSIRFGRTKSSPSAANDSTVQLRRQKLS